MKRLAFIVITLLVSISGLYAQDFYDINTINEIRLYFTQTNWDQLLDNLFAQGNEDRLLGNAVINGVAYDSVGVRYKGNSSYSSNRVKNPFNIKLDYMIDEQLIGNYGTIKLANGFSDPSFVRETLSYEIARKYMPAGKANYAQVYVNDVLIGAYTSVQDVDSYFMSENFHASGKPRFKCDTNTFNAIPVWGYLGADSLAYAQYYGIESDFGWAELMNFTNTMSNNPNSIHEVMNVDQNLWMTAFDNLLVNLDSPINVFHNFYLFVDAADRFNPILWDLNMSFGGFPGGGSGGVSGMQQLDPLRNSTSSTYLLLSRILSNARYKKQYIAHMRTMLTENFSNGWYATRAAELQGICGPIVQSDPNAFYTYANFQANLNNSVTGGSGGPGGQSVPGLTQLMNTRATYLLNSTAFSGTVPTITDITHSPETIIQNSIVDFNMMTSNATYAQLGIRQDIKDKFTYYQMFDDGSHNDGAANDGVYGVSVELGFGNIQYFGWAESGSQGAFLPARAEHEFFEAEVLTEPGEILINEIQAKNASYFDPFGDNDDWVELYNPGTTPVDIGGMYMVDSHFSNGVTAWTQISTAYPDSTTIPANGHLIIWFDEETDEGILHINDKLGGGADAVYLIDSDATTVIDSKAWVDADGLNVDDVSFGRTPDGAGTWQLFGAGQANPCTPGAANAGTANNPPVISNISYNLQIIPPTTAVEIHAEVTDSDGTIAAVELVWATDGGNNFTSMTLGSGVYSAAIGPFDWGTVITYYIQAMDNSGDTSNSVTYHITIGYQAPTLFINEIMPANTSMITDEANEYEDWVEIYNPGDEAIDLAGYFLVDNHYGESSFVMSSIPEGFTDQTTIPAHGFKILWFDEDLDQGPLHVNTKLGTSEDSVYLLAPDMITVIDHIDWTADTALLSDLSWGRYPDGTITWTLFGAGQTHPVTPNASNGAVANDDPSIPALAPALNSYPNPMRDSISIEIKNTAAPAMIRVYNIKGQLVSKINVSGKAVWNGTDINGKRLGEGIYILKTNVNGSELIRRVCLIR